MLGQPDVIHDVSAMADKKIATLNAHASQTVWMMKEMEQKLAAQDPDALKWLHNERFYTYNWQKDFE